MTVVQPQDVQVLVRGGEETGKLTIDQSVGGFRLMLTSRTGRWTGEGFDVFEALRDLRRHLDLEEVLIGVAGAQPNVWASGLQRDMGSGLSAYVLTIPQPPGRPPTVETLSPAPCIETGTVADQDAFQARWHDSRQS